MLHPIKRYGWRFAFLVVALVAAAGPLIAQAADSTATVITQDPLSGLTLALFTGGGALLYQLAKFLISPLDRLPAPIHMAIVTVGNVLWQLFAPGLSARLGVDLPAQLAQVGPAVLTGILMALAMMGTHGMYQRFRDWLKGRGWWPTWATPATA